MIVPWFRAFLLTLAVELPVAVWLLGPSAGGVARRAAVAAGASLATHPLVWFVFPGLGWGWIPTVALSEVWAVGVEAAWFGLAASGAGRRRVLLAALAANAASFLLGLLLFRLAPAWMLRSRLP